MERVPLAKLEDALEPHTFNTVDRPRVVAKDMEGTQEADSLDAPDSLEVSLGTQGPLPWRGDHDHGPPWQRLPPGALRHLHVRGHHPHGFPPESAKESFGRRTHLLGEELDHIL